MFCIEALGERSAATKAYYTIVSRGDGPYTVGRQDTNNIVISNSPDVSRQHATLEVMSFREFLNQCPGAYENYMNSDRAEERQEYLDFRAKREQERQEKAIYGSHDDFIRGTSALANGGDPLEEAEAAAMDDEDEALMLSLVLCVRHYSKTGTTEIRVSRPLDDLIENAEKKNSQERARRKESVDDGDDGLRTRARTSTLRPEDHSSDDDEENVVRTLKSPNDKLAEGPLILRVSSVAFIPSQTDDAYAISFGSKAHFKITFRPVIVAISQLHFSSEYVREMTLMYRQLGCTVLGDGNPTPTLDESSFQRELVTHVGFVGAVSVEEHEEEQKRRRNSDNNVSTLQRNFGRSTSNTSKTGNTPHQQRREPSINPTQLHSLFTVPTRPRFFYNPLAKIHVCEEIDESSGVLNALTIGYMLALPVYIFELFAIIATDASRPLHTLPHPSQAIGGASAEPQQKRDVYGCTVYCYPDSITAPFSLYPIPSSSTTNRSRVRLFKDRTFYIPNPILVRRNQMPLAMGGCARPLYMGMEQLPPNNAAMTAERILKQRIEEQEALDKSGKLSTAAATTTNKSKKGGGGSAANASVATNPDASSFSPLTAGSYVIVSTEMEMAVKELYLLAQAHFASYQRYPMAILMQHPQIIQDSVSMLNDTAFQYGDDGGLATGGPVAAANPIVFEELKVISLAVHRGYIPITERCVHTALLANKFIPEVVDEFVAWCVDEQRHVGLHLKGKDAFDHEAALNEAEMQQRRELISVMFGEMLSEDPDQVTMLLQQHNDSLFQQLSADKASRYALVEREVLKAGPSNLGGGLLRLTDEELRKHNEKNNMMNNNASGHFSNTDVTNADPTHYLEGNKRAARRSLPIPNTDFALPHHEKKQQAGAYKDPYHEVDELGRVRAVAVSPGRQTTIAADNGAEAVANGGDNGEDWDSDATPSDLDSVDHELNKIRVKGYHTHHLASYEDKEQFRRTLADSLMASEKQLNPEMKKLTSLYNQVEKNRAILAGGGVDAHASNSMIINKSLSPERNNAMNSIANTSALNRTSSPGGKTVGARRPSSNFPLAKTTISSHTIAYVNTLLQQHILPQLERLETCALTREARTDHGAVQALWDEADRARTMCEEILANHEKELVRLSQRNSNYTNVNNRGAAALQSSNKRYLGYTATELDSAEDNFSSTLGSPNQQRDSPQRNPQTAASRGARGGGVNANFLRSASGSKPFHRNTSGSALSRNGSPARNGVSNANASTASSISRGYNPSLKVFPSDNTVAKAKAGATAAPRQQNFPFKPAPKLNSSVAPYSHHSKLDGTFTRGSTAVDSSVGFNGSGAGVDPSSSSFISFGGGDAYQQGGGGYDSIAEQTRNALSFEASQRNTNTPTRRTQTNSAFLRNSAEQRNSRYAPLPLFAAQKVHKSQAMQATTTRVHLGGGQLFSDSDPTKIHLTGEERVDATLHEEVQSYDTNGVARRRQLFFYRYGPEEGNKRFVLWLNSQTPKWTREFHRTLEMKNLRFSDLLDSKFAW